MTNPLKRSLSVGCAPTRADAARTDDRDVQIRVNGSALRVPAGTIVAAAIARASVARFRRSVLGEPRGPLCGMGICMECRVTIDGQPHIRSCVTLCAEGMEVATDE